MDIWITAMWENGIRRWLAWLRLKLCSNNYVRLLRVHVVDGLGSSSPQNMHRANLLGQDISPCHLFDEICGGWKSQLTIGISWTRLWSKNDCCLYQMPSNNSKHCSTHCKQVLYCISVSNRPRPIHPLYQFGNDPTPTQNLSLSNCAAPSISSIKRDT